MILIHTVYIYLFIYYDVRSVIRLHSTSHYGSFVRLKAYILPFIHSTSQDESVGPGVVYSIDVRRVVSGALICGPGYSVRVWATNTLEVPSANSLGVPSAKFHFAVCFSLS